MKIGDNVCRQEFPCIFGPFYLENMKACRFIWGKYSWKGHRKQTSFGVSLFSWNLKQKSFFMSMWFFPCADLRNGWKLISPKKSFVVYAATGVEKQQWISHIKKCVSDLLTRSKVFMQWLQTLYSLYERQPLFLIQYET